MNACDGRCLMKNQKKQIKALAFLVCGVLFGTVATQAQTQDRPIKIGVLSDMSGPYADQAGLGSVEAARMAIEDAGNKIGNQPIELVSADHQHKTDVATSIVRHWIDVDGVDVIADMPNSGVALAVQALVAKGDKSWFFLTVDYALGISLQTEASKAITALGGTVVGSVRHPLNNPDFSSFLLQAQASDAKVIAFANAGSDTINSVKQAGEFGLTKNHVIVAPLVYISDIHSMGLPMAQGLTYIEGFYWDLNDDTRAWSKRFFERRKAMPTMTHAGVYSAVSHYLKAVKAVGTSDSLAVLAKMREMPVDDFFSRGGIIRKDGRMVHDMLLVQVKTPAESKYPWDYYKVLATIPGDQAFRPIAESECPLVKQ